MTKISNGVRHQHKFGFLILITVAALVGGLAACTKRSATGAGGVSAPKERVFRYRSQGKISTLDPHMVVDVYSEVANAAVAEPLYGYHPFKRPLSLEPLLAAEMPVFSKDKKTVTIALKKGIHFQDDPCFAANNGIGRELKASDVVYSFERLASAKMIGARGYEDLSEKVVGMEAYHKGQAPTIAGIKAVDDYTVQFQLVNVFPRFIMSLTTATTAIVPKECVEKYGEEFSRHPVGTGPFKVVQADLSSKVVYQRNPKYTTKKFPTDVVPAGFDAKAAGDGTLPLLDKFIVEVIVESQPAWLKFLSGELDWLTIPKDSVAVAVSKEGKPTGDLAKTGAQLFREPGADVVTIIFNMKDPVWGKNKLLRQAVAFAVDYDKLIELGYAGQAVKAQSIVDPSQYGYDDQFKSQAPKRDLAKAKALLAQAGYPDGKGLAPIEVAGYDGTDQRNIMEVIKRSLEEAGLQLKMEVSTWPEFLVRTRQQKFQMVMLGWGSTVPDVEASMSCVDSRYIASGQNPAAYANPTLDGIMKKVRTLENGPERLALIKQFKDILDDDMPMIAIIHRVRSQVVQSWIKNYVFLDEVHLGWFAKYLDSSVVKK